MAPTRSLRYVCRPLGSMRNYATSFLGHHISATFELRAGVVKARRPAQRVGAQRRALTRPSTARRSRCGGRSKRERIAECACELRFNPREICDAYASENARANGRADLTDNARVIATATLGREQPPEQGSGSPACADRGVAHAPAQSATRFKCVRCAAQNAALFVRALSLQMVAVGRLAREDFVDTASSAVVFD